MNWKTKKQTKIPHLNATDRAFYANLFRSVTDEMGVTLIRTAYSPNIKERRDCSCALFDHQAQMIAQSAHIPIHLGAMPASVQAAIETCSPFEPGDVIILNDPFAGGTHLPDITLVTPLHAGDKRPIGFLASRAHHADVGGMTPGSLPLSTSIFAEGIRIPPLRMVHSGVLNQEVVDLLMSNTRTPKEREGDLRAQLAAHKTGERRFIACVEKYGAHTIQHSMGDILNYGETMMRSLIRAIPNGTYRFQDLLDGDGICSESLPIHVSIVIRGSKAIVDFSGTSAACDGSLNAVKAITDAAVCYCFLCLLVTPSKLHDEPPVSPPLNSGCFRPLMILAEEGSLVNARPPHAVAGGNVETSQRIVDAVLGALAIALPEVIPAASQGTMNNLTLGGVDPHTGEPYAYYETIAGGMGGRPYAPGLDAIQTHMTNTMNTPIEALEFAYPLRAEKYAIRDRSGGAGIQPGGRGALRELRILAPAQGTILSERREHPPYGLLGGGPGKKGRNSLIRNGKHSILPGKCHLVLQPEDIIRIETPGGGGHGSL